MAIPRPSVRTTIKKSNIKTIEIILKDAGEPLRVDEIIRRAKESHGVVLMRESTVSALTKRILDGRTFKRAGKSVYGLLEWEGAHE